MELETKFLTGINEIDNQHRELLRLVAQVAAAVSMDQGWSPIHYSILAVKQFASFHFEFEEALMRMFGFAGCDQHAEEHRQLLKKAEEIVQTSLSSDVEKNIMQFTYDWLTSHIQGSDKLYAEYILAGARVVG